MHSTLWAWGDNSSGQLGRADLDHATDPVPLPLPPEQQVTAVSTGCGHSLAVLSDGTVIGWGRNVFGQAGGGRPGGVTPPVAVPGLRDVVAVAAGGGHSLALDSAGQVWGWGAGFFGMLGSVGAAVHPVPQPIDGATDIVAIAAGGSHNLALTASGRLLMWGRDDHGQLGDPTRRHFTGRRVIDYAGSRFDCRFAPGPVDGVTGITQIAAGGGHALVVTGDGDLLTWGFNDRGQLGRHDRFGSGRPQRVAGVPPVGSVGAGYHHTVVAGADGSVFAWGLNDGGQLGDGSVEDAWVPVKVIGLPPVAAVDANGGGSDLAAGRAGHSLALGADGSVWEWGYLLDGNGSAKAVTTARRVGLGGGVRVVAAGGEIPDMSRRATEGEYAEEPTGGFTCVLTDDQDPS